MIYNVIDHKSQENKKSLEEHRTIVHSIKQTDITLTQQAIRNHLQTTLHSIKKYAGGYKSLNQSL
ncbi:hypothetical protein [Bacillus sp. 2205SS5-2]|uniref:hypothetical protein n=1 Tax=Bacillus sp. 2205SS5-2 TaxID=3109031 RepID=UPI0030060799